MPFFTFSQNNSGGSFYSSENLTHFVIVEAESASEADDKLEMLGGYFDGCENGRDCDCCGDRWYRSYKGDETEVPEVYCQTPEDYTGEGSSLLWMGKGQEIVVHYLDGRKEWF